MYPGLLECFNRRSLGVRKAGFRAAFGEYPAPSATGLDQQELDGSAAKTITNCGDLFAFGYLDELRDSNALNRSLPGTQG
jgi:hypothetical protein